MSDAAERARTLEEHGYDAAWAGGLNQDPFLPLAVAAGAPGRITLGTSIAVALARSPTTSNGTAAAGSCSVSAPR